MRTNSLKKLAGSSLTLFIMNINHATAFTLPIDNIKAEIYGYAKLNAVYDIDQDIGSTTQAGSFASLFPENDINGHFDADAEESRLGVFVEHETGLKIRIEGDFRGGTLRLRQAYGEYNNWLIGQAWSNYNSFTGWTTTLDFDSSSGGPGVQDRVSQVRYTKGNFVFSLEDDYFPNIANIADERNEKSSLPVFVTRYESSSDGISFVASGLLRQLSADDGQDLDETAVGYGFFLGTTIELGRISFQGNINVSDGASGYLYRSGTDFIGPDGYIDASGDLETVSGFGGTVGVSFKVDQGTFNLSYGLTTLDLDDIKDDLGDGIINNPATTISHETNETVFLNYIWSPIENVEMGVEYGYFKAELENGNSNDASRLMYSAWYNF